MKRVVVALPAGFGVVRRSLIRLYGASGSVTVSGRRVSVGLTRSAVSFVVQFSRGALIGPSGSAPVALSWTLRDSGGLSFVLTSKLRR